MDDALPSDVPPASDGYVGLYPALTRPIDEADSGRQIGAIMRVIVDDLTKRVPTDKVRQVAKGIGVALLSVLRDASSPQDIAKARLLAKKQVMYLLTTMKEEVARLANTPDVEAVPSGPVLPFTVAGERIETFLPEFLGKYIMHILSPLHVTRAATPERLPWMLAPDFAPRLGQVVQEKIAPFLMEYRIVKVRLAENFNVKEQGVAGMIAMMSTGKDNAVHYVWDNFWQPPAPAGKASGSEQRRSDLLRSVWRELNGLGHGELTASDIEVLRRVIHLSSARLAEEVAIAIDSIAKIRNETIRPTFIRERLEKLITDALPTYGGELVLLKLCAEQPDYFNDEWVKWFLAGFRDRKEHVAVFTRYLPQMRAAIGGS